jgi:hypothetical protein
MQPFRGRRSGKRFESEQIGDGFGGRGEFEIRSVNHFFGERRAAIDLNGLTAMMRFVAAGAPAGAGLGSA